MIVAILLTVFIYLVLQRVEDKRRERAQQPPAAVGSRIGLLFFVAIVCFVGSYLIENMGLTPQDKGAFVEGAQYEQEMFHSIHEPIHVGLPPF